MEKRQSASKLDIIKMVGKTSNKNLIFFSNNNNKNTSVPVTRIYLFTSAHMGEKERNSSFYTDVWFLLISGECYFMVHS